MTDHRTDRPSPAHPRVHDPAADAVHRTLPRQRRPRTGAMLLGGAAVALAGLAAYNVLQTRRAERRHPPQGRFINVDGVRLRYLDEGRGDVVVLVHGNGALIEDMTSSGLVDVLSRSRRVIVLDRPGFGYSSRPRDRLFTPERQAQLFNAALDLLGVKRAVVYGHSLGAQVAAFMALDRPDRVRGLVLASGYYYPTARADVPFALPPAIPVLGDVLRYTVAPPLTAALLPRIYAKLFDPAPVPDHFWRRFPHALVRRPLHLRAAATDTGYLIPAAAALRRRYAELKMPVAIITGDGDQMVDVDRHARRLHRELPGSRLVEVPGAGHMIHHLALDEVVALIDNVAEQEPVRHRAQAQPRPMASL